VVEQLVEHGEVHRGWLGVGIDPVTEEAAKKANGQEGVGVIINSVFEGDPADRAGLKVGDIILKIGGSDINSPNKMIRVIGAITPGQTINMNILRDGKSRMVPIKLESRTKKTLPLAAVPSLDSLGFSVEDRGKDINLPNGVLVSHVNPESTAGLKGLLSGDLITAVNGDVVDSRIEFAQLLGEIEKGSPIFLLVWRNEEKFHLGIVREN
jgi:serine protease Do